MGQDNKNTPAAKAAQSWDDGLAAALPQKAAYFNSMRTKPFINQNMVANYLEFCVALQVDVKQDKWRVMRYMIFDLNQPDGLFKTENVGKTDMSFPEAVYQVAQFEKAAESLPSYQPAELTEKKYPAGKYPELKVHFFDIEHYEVAAHIEGIAFNTSGRPYRRVEGKIVSETSFQRSEIGKSILGVEQARDNPIVAAKIEAGILSDIYNSASDRAASLDSILKVGETLACLDRFAAQIGAFYLGVQSVLGLNDKFDKISGMTADEKKTLLHQSSLMKGMLKKDLTLLAQMLDVLPQAETQLDNAEKLGVHVEPFRKFVAECELYANLLDASENLKALEKGFAHAGGADMKLIETVRKSVDLAQQQFTALGGSAEQVDRLKAWVANPKKDPVPQWLPGFLDRYYDQRRKVMQKVQDRQAGVREVKTMSVKVKPPVV